MSDETPKPWVVQIVAFRGRHIIHEIPCQTERKAERVEDGVTINLNHEEFYTNIKERETK